MERPRYVSDAITVSAEGLHTGQYGALTLFSAYQPIYALDGSDALRLAAFEGLIRPRHGGEPVSPAALFSNIDPGDQLFVECLCRALHLRNYPNAAPGGQLLFININPAIYESIEVVEREFKFMFSILGKYDLSPERLVCEVIETDALSQGAMERLWAMLRDHGAKLAIDDFGAGRSGIDRYRLMQPDIVKVDGELFRAMAADSKRIKMLRAMLRTFRADSATVLVEGIETAEQLEIAQHVGATLFQGYYLGKPALLPAQFAPALPLAQSQFDGLCLNSL